MNEKILIVDDEDAGHGWLRGLQDIGKIGIPDSILLKPGPLIKDEFAIMKTHCAIGEKILSG